MLHLLLIILVASLCRAALGSSLLVATVSCIGPTGLQIAEIVRVRSALRLEVASVPRLVRVARTACS